LLHDDGMTIKGVQKLLREQGVDHVSSLSPSLDETVASAIAAAKGGPSVLVFQEKADVENGQIELDIGAPGLASASGPAEAAGEPGSGTVAMPRDAESAAELERDSTLEEDPDQVAAELDPGAGGRLARAAEEDTVSSAEPPAEDVLAEPVTEESVTAEAPEAGETPTGALPSFLRHRRDDVPAEPSPAEAAPDTEETEEPRSRARDVDAPDPPADNEIEATAGLLSRLAHLRELSPEQAQALAPIAQELKSLYDRQVEAARLEIG
ncbi:MAG: hypothetical protein AAGA05_06080, partial [Pseudomonadota bacterium]